MSLTVYGLLLIPHIENTMPVCGFHMNAHTMSCCCSQCCNILDVPMIEKDNHAQYMSLMEHGSYTQMKKCVSLDRHSSESGEAYTASKNCPELPKVDNRCEKKLRGDNCSNCINYAWE